MAGGCSSSLPQEIDIDCRRINQRQRAATPVVWSVSLSLAAILLSLDRRHPPPLQLPASLDFGGGQSTTPEIRVRRFQSDPAPHVRPNTINAGSPTGFAVAHREPACSPDARRAGLLPAAGLGGAPFARGWHARVRLRRN